VILEDMGLSDNLTLITNREYNIWFFWRRGNKLVKSYEI